MVYLLNAKLKRALNGEKIDDKNLNEKENEDNDFCHNCNLLRKEKKLLEDKVQNLLDNIHKKDLEIAKLKEMLCIGPNVNVFLAGKGKKGKKNKKKGSRGEKGENPEKGKDGKKNKDGKKKILEKIKLVTKSQEKNTPIHYQMNQMMKKLQKKMIKIVIHYLREMKKQKKLMDYIKR